MFVNMTFQLDDGEYGPMFQLLFTQLRYNTLCI